MEARLVSGTLLHFDLPLMDPLLDRLDLELPTVLLRAAYRRKVTLLQYFFRLPRVLTVCVQDRPSHPAYFLRDVDFRLRIRLAIYPRS